MPVHAGTAELRAIYAGTDEVVAAYEGANEVWASGATMELIGTTSGSDTSIEIPAEAQAGDLLVVWNLGLSDPEEGVGGGLPSGFTELAHDTDSGLVLNYEVYVSARIHDGSEATRSGLNGDDAEFWVCKAFRPTAPFASLVENGFNDDHAGGNPSPQNIAVESAETLPVLAWGVMVSSRTQGNITPSVSPEMTEITTGVLYMKGHFEIFNSVGELADISYDMNDAGANYLASGYLTFVPA